MKKKSAHDDSDEFDVDEPEEFEESGSDWDPEDEGANTKKRKSRGGADAGGGKAGSKKTTNKRKKTDTEPSDDEKDEENEDEEEEGDKDEEDSEDEASGDSNTKKHKCRGGGGGDSGGGKAGSKISGNRRRKTDKDPSDDEEDKEEGDEDEEDSEDEASGLTGDTDPRSTQKEKIKLDIPSSNIDKNFPFLEGFLSCVKNNNGVVTHSLLQEYWDKCVKDERETPNTPVIVSMIFDKKELMEAMFLNLNLRRANFKDEVLKELVKFTENSFRTLSSKVGLQILLHFSKIDLEDSKFIDMLYNFLLAQNDIGDDEYIIEDSVLKKEILKYLKKPVILKAISETLKLNLNYEIDDAELINLLNIMEVYSAEVFYPLACLRGAALQTGIVIFKRTLATHRKAGKLLAHVDAITLALHESTHFIARSVLKNFNFSSPYKRGEKLKPPICYDATYSKPLELGRAAEIRLFGFQPQWLGSTAKIAQSFLDKLNSDGYIFPIFGENKPEGLLERTLDQITTGSALDMMDSLNLG